VPEHNVGNFSKDKLKGIASGLGLDASSFSACLDSDRYQSWVQQELDAARGRSLIGTPSLFVNGRKLERLPATIDDLQRLLTPGT
jgi:predicted DsbA family dithiol-disulfide isomerase